VEISYFLKSISLHLRRMELPMCSCYKDIFYILIFWWLCVRPLTTSQQDDEIPQDFTGGDLLEVEGLAQGPQKRNL